MEYPVSEIPQFKKDKFRELIEGLNVITYEFDLAECRFTYVSRMAESILGYPSDVWKSRGFWLSHLHPDDREWASEYSRFHSSRLQDHEFEYRMMTKDGRIKWFKDITTVHSENMVSRTLHGVLIDMTDRKETETELLKSKDRYQALVEQQTEMITRWKPDGTFTFVNEVFCNFFEKTRSELIGKTYIPQMPVEDLERFSKFLVQLNKDNPVGHFTHRVIRPDGEIRWLRWTDTAILDKEGNITEYQTVGRDVTSRKKAEDALRDSEQQLQLIFENAPIGMALTDFKRNFIKVNKAYCNIVGYTKDELMKLKFDDFTHSDDRKLDDEIYDRSEIKGPPNVHYEKRYISKQGKTIHVEVHLSVLRNSSGQPYQQIAQVVDITERKESEQKLKLTQARLSAVLNNLPNVAIYEFGKNVNFVSENIMEILGYSAEEFMKNERMFGELILNEDFRTYSDIVNEWKKTGAKGVVSNVLRVRNKANEIVWIEDHMFELTPETGDPYFSGIMIDITEQKEAQQRIQDTETKLALILKNLPKVVVYQYVKGKDFISENIAEMTGYSSEEILKENNFFGKKMHPDDLKIVRKMLAQWRGNNSEGILILEFRLKKKDDEYIWIEDHMYKVKTSDGESYISGVLIDVTERKLFEQKISQSLKEKELLLKEIHHRVKNNLQVVSSLLKLQSGSIKDNHLLDHSRNILVDSQNRVRSMALVHQKLYQSKDFSKIDFSEYLKQLSDHLFNAFKSTSGKVEMDIQSEKVSLSIDLAIPCGLIINELVSNSLKYAFPDGRGGKIELRLLANENNAVSISVNDNGIGFPKGIDYRNTKSLGLQLVNTLVRQIDGTIAMVNHSGTNFEIKFRNKASKIRA